MKTIIVSINFLIFSFGFTQVQPLEDHTWILDKIVTADSTLVVSQNMIIEMNFDDNFFIFGNCGPLNGELFHFDTSQNFEVDEFELGTPISPCPDQPNVLAIENFFQDEFFFEQNFISTYEPFAYIFTNQNNKIYLDITNSEGSVATFFVDLLSQEDFLKQNLVIYPNPVKDKLFIESPNMSLEQVTIYDLSGKMVFEQKDIFDDNLDISHLQSGVYILKLKTPVGVVQRKLVKK